MASLGRSPVYEGDIDPPRSGRWETREGNETFVGEEAQLKPPRGR